MTYLAEELGFPEAEAGNIVATGMASFTAERMEAVIGANDLEGFGKGVQFGFGRGKTPVSNFNGGQTLARPLLARWGRREAIGTDALLRNVRAHRDDLSRVTVKTGLGTDPDMLAELMRDVNGGTTGAKKVLSDIDPYRLTTIAKQVGRSVDRIQLDLSWLTVGDVKNAVLSVLHGENIAAVNEIALPIPSDDAGSERLISVAELLSGAGKDLYLGPAKTQAETRRALSVIRTYNASGRGNRITGFSFE